MCHVQCRGNASFIYRIGAVPIYSGAGPSSSPRARAMMAIECIHALYTSDRVSLSVGISLETVDIAPLLGRVLAIVIRLHHFCGSLLLVREEKSKKQ